MRKLNSSSVICRDSRNLIQHEAHFTTTKEHIADTTGLNSTSTLSATRAPCHHHVSFTLPSRSPTIKLAPAIDIIPHNSCGQIVVHMRLHTRWTITRLWLLSHLIIPKRSHQDSRLFMFNTTRTGNKQLMHCLALLSTNENSGSFGVPQHIRMQSKTNT